MCQHNKRFDEWWAKQVDNGGTWTTLERLAAKDAWEAATKLVEEKFTSTNTARDETVRSCTNCGNEHCSMQAGVCSKWVQVKRTASPVA
jgi:hypothetical protein